MAVFFTFIEECCVKRTSTKSLQIELVTKYNTNDAWKESLVEGSISAVTTADPNPDNDVVKFCRFPRTLLMSSWSFQFDENAFLQTAQFET